MPARILVLLLTLATGCTGSAESDTAATTCEVDGVTHEAGETWDAGDGCNTCSCESDGSASCTELGCL